MIVTIEDEDFEIPNTLGYEDEITLDGNNYSILKKVYDINSKTIKCILKRTGQRIVDIFKKLYESNHLTTSGLNTNEITNNPRIITILSIATVLLNEDDIKTNAKKYKDNIVKNWRNLNIPWSTIFDDNPYIKNYNFDMIQSLCCSILKQTNIPDKLWPINIYNYYQNIKK